MVLFQPRCFLVWQRAAVFQQRFWNLCPQLRDGVKNDHGLGQRLALHRPIRGLSFRANLTTNRQVQLARFRFSRKAVGLDLHFRVLAALVV